MDEGIAMLLCQPVSMLTGFVVDISIQHHLSAIALGALHLHQGRRGRHDDDRLRPIGLRRVGYALSMVAGGSGNQAFGPLLVRQGADLIVGASDLVGACHLHVFRLQVDLVAGLLAEILAVKKLCLNGGLFDHLGGFLKFL